MYKEATWKGGDGVPVKEYHRNLINGQPRAAGPAWHQNHVSVFKRARFSQNYAKHCKHANIFGSVFLQWEPDNNNKF